MTTPVAGPGGIPLWESGSRITGTEATGGAAHGAGKTSATGDGANFLQQLKSALWQVNDFQVQAQEAGQGLASGSVDDVAKAMIAAQKATLALDMTVEVRNRALDAYQEVMRMQI